MKTIPSKNSSACDDYTRLSVDLSQSLHKAFKLKVFDEHTEIRNVVAQMIEHYILGKWKIQPKVISTVKDPARLNVDLPKSVHRTLKRKVLEEDTEIRIVMIQIIEDYVVGKWQLDTITA